MLAVLFSSCDMGENLGGWTHHHPRLVEKKAVRYTGGGSENEEGDDEG